MAYGKKQRKTLNMRKNSVGPGLWRETAKTVK